MALLTLAVLVLIGRFGGVKSLVTLVPGAAPMAFPTLVGFVVLGLGLLAQSSDRPLFGGIAGVGLVLFGLGAMTFYMIADILGIERFAYDPANPIMARGVGLDGRISPNASGSFALLGGAMLMLRARKPWIGGTAVVLSLVFTITLLAIVGHVTGLRSTVAWWRHTGMAISAALGFFVAALALFHWFVRRVATTDKVVTRTLPFFVVAGTAMLGLCAVVLVSNEQRQASARLENHTLQMEAAIERFIASVARLQVASRDYALTGDAPYLARIDVHRASVIEAVEVLVRLTVDQPAQHRRVLGLRPLVAQAIAVNDELVRAREQHGAAAAAAVLRAEAPELVSGLREVTDGLEGEERSRLVQRRAETALNEQRLRWVLVAGALVTIGLMVGAFSLVHAAQRELQRANEHLEQRVHVRTAEVEASAEQLRESERRLRFLADTMPQLVWTARADGVIESLNLGWREYLGAQSEAEAMAAYASAVHADDLAATMREWEGMLRERRAAGGEARLRRADGEYRWHLWRAHPEFDGEGEIVRWVGTWTDIHDQKIAEVQLEQRVVERTTELAASEARFRQAFDFAGIGMAIVGLDGRWLRVNTSICEIVGYAEAELLQKTFQDITHPEDLAADLALLNELVAGQRRFYQMEKRYFHREGRVVWVRLTVSMVRDQADEPVHFVSQIEDITTHKRLEENLARARDQALEASRLKSEFLATMSHEIRTPMNGVIGMTTLLRDTPLSAAQAEYVRTIEASGESLLSIINDILDYSKIEAGRMELEVAPFELRRCVQEALDLFVGTAQEKQIELRPEIGERVPDHWVGDPTRLRQVLVNLLGNALKFSEAGSVVVRAEAEPGPAADGRVESEHAAASDTRAATGNSKLQTPNAKLRRLRFSVSDTGIGIPPEGMERLFKSFSQVDASTTRRFGGTGLGLAISKRLTELMGGTMWAESKPGAGSTFYFTVLVEPGAPEAAQPAITDVPRQDKTLGVRQPLRLLIAEDNAVNQRVAQLLLKRIGYSATIVANGLEAMAALEVTDYDVILMDVEMPELDGCETTRRIRALRRSKTRPWIIALTAGAMQGDRERAFVAGMNDFVAKPVRAEALSEALFKAHAVLAVEGNSDRPSDA